jgi:hypothetical protein
MAALSVAINHLLTLLWYTYMYIIKKLKLMLMKSSLDKPQLIKMNTAMVDIIFCGASAKTSEMLSILPEAAHPSDIMENAELSGTEKADLINGIAYFLQDNVGMPFSSDFIRRFSMQKLAGLSKKAMRTRLEAFNIYLLSLSDVSFSGVDNEGQPIDLHAALLSDIMRIKKIVGRAYLEDENLQYREQRDKVIYGAITGFIEKMLACVDDVELQGNILKTLKVLEKGGHLSTKHPLLQGASVNQKEALQEVLDALYQFQCGDLEKDNIVIMPGEESLAYSLTRDVVSRWMLF